MYKRVLLGVLAVGVMIGLLVWAGMDRTAFHVSGFVEGYQLRLGSRVGGRVSKVQVNEGDRVVTDQSLVELAPFDLKHRLAGAIAELAAKQAEYRKMQAGYRTEQIEKAKAYCDQLQAKLDELIQGPRPQTIAEARAMLQASQAELKFAIRSIATDSQT